MTTTTDNDVTRALRALNEGWRKLGNPNALYEFILRNGKQQAGSPLPEWMPMGVPRQCFANAAQLALSCGMTYVDGFAASHVLAGYPIHHAWVLGPEGEVIDPTWKTPEKCTYIGVSFDDDVLREHLLAAGTYGILETVKGFNFELMSKIDPGLMTAVRGSVEA